MSSSRTEFLRAAARRAPVIPVVTIADAERAVPLAETLVAAGLPVVEVTLRTAAALEAIRAIVRAVPGAVVAAGTVTSLDQAGAAVDAGAAFLVTPGTPPRLAAQLADLAIPVMPGCATPSEAIALADHGFEVLKFFPAGVFGGPAWLKAVHGPLSQLTFCPTGGVDAQNAAEYLALPNVVCVGGTWMASPRMIAEGDFATIGRLAREAATLPRRTLEP